MGRTDYETETMLPVAHSLRADGFDASEDGTGRGTPIVPVAYSIMPMNSGKDYKARPVDVAQPVMAGGPVGGNQGGDYVAQPVGVTIHGTDKTARVASYTEVAGSLRARPPGGQENSSTTAVMAFAQNQRDEVRLMDVAGALASEPGMKQQTYLHTGWRVRRLTPTECERLQGFPDGYTDIPYGRKREWISPNGPSSEGEYSVETGPVRHAPDGPRYKALGNSMAVNCMRWLGLRIQLVETTHA